MKKQVLRPSRRWFLFPRGLLEYTDAFDHSNTLLAYTYPFITNIIPTTSIVIGLISVERLTHTGLTDNFPRQRFHCASVLERVLGSDKYKPKSITSSSHS